MSLLLDTHAVIWLAADLERVPPAVQERVAAEASVFVSFVSGWEYGIKRSKRPSAFARSFDELVEGAGFEKLGLDYDMHPFAESLPLLHHDPFDRMLIAQALAKGLTLVTQDQDIRRYDVPTFW